MRGAFIGLDGLVMQPPEDSAMDDSGDGGGSPPRTLGRVFTFERLPGFNGLGRLLLVLERLGLATIAADGASVALRPADLTPARFAAARRAHTSELPEERGIENVHSFTYSKTFAAASTPPTVVAAGAVAGAGVWDDLSAHRCLFVLEQFWTANFWHWTTDALPKVLLYKPAFSQSAIRAVFHPCRGPRRYSTSTQETVAEPQPEDALSTPPTWRWWDPSAGA